MIGLVMKYFVLKPKGTDIYARASRAAMLAYASMMGRKEGNQELANDLHDWVERERKDAGELSL